MLLVDERLPVVHTESGRQAEVLAHLADDLGMQPVFLRVVARVLEEDENREYVDELDAPPDDWEPSTPAKWVPLQDVDPEALLPAPLAQGMAQWIEEQRGAPIPPQRPQWARPGWLREVTRWVAEIVGENVEPQIVRQWSLSAVYRFETTSGALYLKAVFPPFRHEPAVTQALAREHPGRVTDVVAIEADRGWMLMREFSANEVADAAPEYWAEAFRVAATIQRAWVGRESELMALGAPQRGLETLRDSGPQPMVDELIERLSTYDVPETIVHGDSIRGMR